MVVIPSPHETNKCSRAQSGRVRLDADLKKAARHPSHSLTGIRDEAVTDAPHRLQVSRARRLVLEIPPQPDNEVVDGAGVGVLVNVPDVLENRLARNGTAFML